MSTIGKGDIIRLIVQKDLEKGKAVNIQIGKAKSRAYGNGKCEGMFTAKLEIAKNLLQVGVDVKLVAKSTGLTIVIKGE